MIQSSAGQNSKLVNHHSLIINQLMKKGRPSGQPQNLQSFIVNHQLTLYAGTLPSFTNCFVFSLCAS